MVYVNSIKRLILKRIFGVSRGFCFLYRYSYLCIMKDINHIKSLLDNNQPDAAIDLLLSIINNNNECEETYFLLGNAYSKKNQWRDAISSYCKAIDINPNSKAKIALTRLQEIMEFYNHDLYNP